MGMSFGDIVMENQFSVCIESVLDKLCSAGTVERPVCDRLSAILLLHTSSTQGLCQSALPFGSGRSCHISGSGLWWRWLPLNAQLLA